MTVSRTRCTEKVVKENGSDRLSGHCSNCNCCAEKNAGSESTVNVKNPFESNSMPNCKLSKSNILDKLHSKLNKLNKLNAHVQKCNDALENSKLKRNSKSFHSKMEFENFLRQTYNESQYSYCILKCGPSVPHRQFRAVQVKDNRISRNMGWNWKATHSENWQQGTLPKVIRMRMSHFLNYYPCDTLLITRLNIKLSKTSFDDADERESKIKKMIHSMGFSPCTCTKAIAWCMCRDKMETNKLKNILQQIEQQIGENGLEYKLYLNDMMGEHCKKMSLYDKRTKSVPDLIHQETQYEPMDYKIIINVICKDKLSKPKNIKTARTAKPNNSAVTIGAEDTKGSEKKSKRK